MSATIRNLPDAYNWLAARIGSDCSLLRRGGTDAVAGQNLRNCLLGADRRYAYPLARLGLGRDPHFCSAFHRSLPGLGAVFAQHPDAATAPRRAAAGQNAAAATRQSIAGALDQPGCPVVVGVGLACVCRSRTLYSGC